MGKFLSVLAAALQYVFSIYLFKRPDLNGSGLLISALTVLVAVFVLLWSLPLYPRRLRKLMTAGNFLAQYIIAVFYTEYIMGCFWFPLEATILALLPKIGTALDDTFSYYDFTCDTLCEFFRQEVTGMVLSYLLSVVILLATLHATRIINLRLLSSGISTFGYDLSRRFNKFSKNFPLNVGITKYYKRQSRKSSGCAPQDDYDEMDPLTDSGYGYMYE